MGRAGQGRARQGKARCLRLPQWDTSHSRPTPPHTLSLSLGKSQPHSDRSANKPERPLTACSPTSIQNQQRPRAVSSAATAILLLEGSRQRRREAAEGPHPSRMPDTLPDAGERRLAPNARHHQQKRLTQNLYGKSRAELLRSVQSSAYTARLNEIPVPRPQQALRKLP